jgi:UDP-N-acetylmuramoyl-L-alanyl-D-glutamate--2,6-diaminopimelate ligase
MAVFTGFSQDHLDLYGTMDAYFLAKLELFESLMRSPKINKAAVINLDDPKGEKIADLIGDKAVKITVGRSEKSDFKIKKTETLNGLTRIGFQYQGQEFQLETFLRGDFNITNTALAAACAIYQGFSPDEIQKGLNRVSGINGRFETVLMDPFQVIVDYAHTPDSLEKILKECRKLTEGKVFCVFGCAGDRDREKRPIMGGISAELADFSIITSDDTYTENPEQIADAVEQGFIRLGITRYDKIPDRREALKKALQMMSPGDLLLAAGMGHEKTRITKEGPVPYNERETLESLLRELNLVK